MSLLCLCSPESGHFYSRPGGPSPGRPAHPHFLRCSFPLIRFSVSFEVTLEITIDNLDLVIGSNWYNTLAGAFAGHSVYVGQDLVSMYPDL